MDGRILSAVRLMERHIGEAVEIDAVAAEVGLSLHHFHRLFASEMQETPAAYLRRIRMDEAAFRLKWANETAGEIAHALGFRSRPAFIRAFERRFGMPPTQYRKSRRDAAVSKGMLNGTPVSLRELEPLRLLARRYIGDVSRTRDYWIDFMSRLPPEMTGDTGRLYVGRMHDDFRISDPDKVRYDCCVTLPGDHLGIDDDLRVRGLHIVSTAPGFYATIQHRGHHVDLPATYDLLCTGWIAPSGRTPASDPALEIHNVPRHLQSPEALDLTVMIAVE
jgi:AraC family transcriptional regulator